MTLIMSAVVLSVVVAHTAAAVYGEHEIKMEMKNYLLYDVKVKYGKGDLHQVHNILSELHLGNAYKVVGEARALFEVADKYACQEHTVDIPDADVDVLIARSLTSLAEDFNITLNSSSIISSYPDNKYLTLIEVTYENQVASGGTSEVLKKIAEGFAAVQNSDDCDNCIRGHVIVGSRSPMVIYIANVKPEDVFDLYSTLGLNEDMITAQARRLVNFHSYREGKASQCNDKTTAHARTNSGIVYDIKPIETYDRNVPDIAIHGGKQSSGYGAKKSVPSYVSSNHDTGDTKLPNYHLLDNDNSNLNYKPAQVKRGGYGLQKPAGYGSMKPSGYNAVKDPGNSKRGKGGGVYGEGPRSGYQEQQDRFYTGYNIPKHAGFMAPNTYNLGSKDRLFVF